MISGAQNPFDFSNPVTDRSILAGRAEEMNETSYYLDQSREGASYSLALIGDRASGKTSLLNSLGEYAQETGLIAAHVRLDEGIAADNLQFFREIFHSLMEAAAKLGVFGGLAGVEYDTFCRQILTADLTTSRDCEPLAFGRVFATAQESGRSIPLSRKMLLSDLTVIVDRCRDAGFPAVVLMIDEADVLASNHPLLQAIRNLLMDSRSFSVVAAGTEQMFPAISEVFSPVPRQFVRINVGPFRSWEDTRKAIQRRLVLAGQEWAMPEIAECREIHSLTRGRPYEVMLVSHFAYRELTRIRQRVPMTITPKAIEGVTDQLEEQNPAVQATRSGLRELDQGEAETIRELIELDGTSIDTFAVAKLDFNKEYSQDSFEDAKNDVQATLERLGRSGFLSIVEGKVRVDADSFQRALIKYLVLARREQGEDVEPTLAEPEWTIANKALEALRVALEKNLAPSDAKSMLSELHGPEANVSMTLAFGDEHEPDEYNTQATVRISSAGDWTGVFVFKADEPEFREKVGAVLLSEVDHLREFEVEITEIEVAPLDRDALQEFQGRLAGDSDPITDAVLEARGEFWRGRPKFRERVARACEAVLARDPSEDVNNGEQLSDCAFMSLGTGDNESFKQLSDRLEVLEDTPILSRVTRGLWEGCCGNYEEALTYLEIDANELGDFPDNVKKNIIMYSPAALARTSGEILYDDLVGGLELVDVLRGYRAAINARVHGEPVSSSLADLDSAPPWLLGAAADAAETEGQPDFAKRIRRRAADSLDAS